MIGADGLWRSLVGPWRERKVRKYRGYWCTNLTGYGGSKGILGEHCVKDKGRYFIKASR